MTLSCGESETSIFGPKTVSVQIAKELSLGASIVNKLWDDSGNIFIDRSPNTDRAVEDAIKRTGDAVKAKTVIYLRQEQQAIKKQFGKDTQFKDFGDYVKFLYENGYIKKKNPGEEGVVRGLLANFTHHWAQATRQVEHGYEEVSSWNDYYKPRSFRLTRWHCISYTEQMPLGGTSDIYNGLTLDDLSGRSNEDYFKTLYLTHTTSPLQALSILKHRTIDSGDRNNFSASAVTTDDPNGDLTYIFDVRDLMRALPLTYGQSTSYGENEITSYFPVPIELARGVFPTPIVMVHDTILRKNTTYSSKGLDPKMIREFKA